MRRAKFIRDLIVDDVVICGDDEVVRYRSRDELTRISPDEVMVSQGAKINEQVVPVHLLRNANRRIDGGIETNDLYIAYSDEVKALLEMPFDAMSEQLKYESERSERLNSSLLKALSENEGYEFVLRRIKGAGFIKRLVFLFTGKIEG